MKELLDKISSYNLFNYLLPGIVFSVVAQNTTSFTFIQSDIVLGVFVYYFTGLIISRFGSLIIEPIMKKLHLIKFAPYPDFLSALKKDPKLEILSEANNMYRTLCSLFLLLALVKIYEVTAVYYSFVENFSQEILVAALFILFIVSYMKQTRYVAQRVKEAQKRK